MWRMALTLSWEEARVQQKLGNRIWKIDIISINKAWCDCDSKMIENTAINNILKTDDNLYTKNKPNLLFCGRPTDRIYNRIEKIFLYLIIK